jgi:hypothetical protein
MTDWEISVGASLIYDKGGTKGQNERVNEKMNERTCIALNERNERTCIALIVEKS